MLATCDDLLHRSRWLLQGKDFAKLIFMLTQLSASLIGGGEDWLGNVRALVDETRDESEVVSVKD
jgi:hypothetical protein